MSGIRKQSSLIICGFCICEFTYSLKLICNSKINIHGPFVIIHRHACAQNRANFESHSSWDWTRWCSAFLFQLICVNKHPSHDLFSAIYFLFFVLILNSVEVLSNASRHKKALMCLNEKIMLDKLCSGGAIVLLALSSMLMNQQYVLNKVSLNRTRLCTDWLTKMLTEAHRNLTLYFP